MGRYHDALEVLTFAMVCPYALAGIPLQDTRKQVTTKSPRQNVIAVGENVNGSF